MTTAQSTLLQLAKQGDAKAIAVLMNQALSEEITAKVSLKDNCLKVMLDSIEAPDQTISSELVRNFINRLNSEVIHQVKIYGRELGEDFPNWQEEFSFTSRALPDVRELAQQGDVEAIKTLIISKISQPDIAIKVSLKNGCLRILLEANDFPEQSALIDSILNEIKALQIQNCTQLKISGREPGDEFPDWQQEFDLSQLTETSLCSQGSSFWGSVFGAVTGAAEVVGSAASHAGGAVVEATTGAVGAVGGAASYAGGAVVGTITGAAEVVGSAASHAGGAVVEATTGAVGAVGNAATQTGEAITGTVFGVAGAIGNTALQATDGVGYALNMIADSPQLQALTKNLNADWLLVIIDRVDIVKAEAQVKKLQRKYPNDKPGDIAHRVMMEKALYVGGSGFATSIAPGWATAMLAVDITATMALQAEMVYQIASAYGLNLQDPSRKGEVLAIFGIALGGSTAIKAGLGLLRNVPVAGAVIGASSNAAMLYALGYAACRFYETKVSSSAAATDFKTSQAASDKYLQDALNQQIVMDQILVHLVLAGKPGKTWQQCLPELKALNLSPAFLDLISRNPKNLPPLEQLLNQLNQDFSVSLLAQCRRIAQADSKITPQEAKILEKITQKCSIN